VDEQISTEQARDHIEMVQRIIAESSQRLCGGGEFFVVWGAFSGLITVWGHLVATRNLPQSSMWAGAALLLACIAFSIVRGRALRNSEVRRSLLQREFLNVLWLTVGLAFVVDIAAFNIFPGLASAAIWSFAEAIVLFYIGLHGNRRAQVCGIAVVVSLVVANFVQPHLSAYVLAAGMIAGYCGFGIAELVTAE
jgi:hypothetical protein